MHFTKITIIKTREQPEATDINELIQWLGGSLGLFNPRDKDKSCYRIFVVLLKQLKSHGSGLSSDDIATATKLSRGTVIHHLNRLMDAGLVSAHRGLYGLRVDSLEELVEQIQAQVNKTFEDVKKVATFLDRRLE